LSAKGQFPAHIDTAVRYFGPKEQHRENYGTDVKKFLNSVGLDEGYSWCASFVSYDCDAADVSYPRIRSALAQDFITNQSIDAKKVLRGQVTIPSGYIFVMKKGDTIHGHTGFVLLPWHGKTGITIEGNTDLGIPGRKDQGVWIKQRQIYSTCYFCIKKFTPVRYPKK